VLSDTLGECPPHWDEVFPEPAPLPGRVVARRRTGLADPTSFRLAQMGRYSGNDVPGGGHFAGGLVPFEPVRIDPGDSTYLVLELRITEEKVCRTPGGAALDEHPTFLFEALGFMPRTSTVETPFRVLSTCGDTVPPDYAPRG
jgi:hypothetical protein